MTNRPLLSICIPTYNRCNYVYESVKSHLNNSYKWIEVVVTDNCSTDETEKMLSSIADNRFRYVKNDQNYGYENLAISLMNGKGKYCLLISDTDHFKKLDWDKVYRQLNDENSYSLLQFDYEDSYGVVLNPAPTEFYKRDTLNSYNNVFGAFFYGAGIVIKRDVLELFWNEIDRNSIIWKLYSQQVIAIWCIKYGD